MYLTTKVVLIDHIYSTYLYRRRRSRKVLLLKIQQVGGIQILHKNILVNEKFHSILRYIFL